MNQKSPNHKNTILSSLSVCYSPLYNLYDHGLQTQDMDGIDEAAASQSSAHQKPQFVYL